MDNDAREMTANEVIEFNNRLESSVVKSIESKQEDLDKTIEYNYKMWLNEHESINIRMDLIDSLEDKDMKIRLLKYLVTLYSNQLFIQEVGEKNG